METWFYAVFFFAGPNCDVGKEYKSCGTEENTRSCYNKTTDITETDSICRPGCYCKSGLIMDGDNCIEPERCGCLYNDFYYSVSIKKTSKEITVLYLEISRHHWWSQIEFTVYALVEPVNGYLRPLNRQLITY